LDKISDKESSANVVVIKYEEVGDRQGGVTKRQIDGELDLAECRDRK
jgi:hypothetical protein